MTSPPDQLEQVQQTRHPGALLALGLGIGFDLAFNTPRLGLGVALFAVVAAAALRPALRESWEDDLLLIGAVVLAGFTAIIAAEWLVALNLMMAAALVIGAAARSTMPLFSVTVLDLLMRAGRVVASTVHAPAGLLLPLGRSVERVGAPRLRAFIRVVAIASPILLIFALLLGSADKIFGDLIIPELPTWDLAGWSIHAGWICLGALLAMTVLIAASRPKLEAPDTRALPRALRPLEWGTILAGVDALFALFVVIQIRFLFGGDGHVEVTPGLTYAEYARSGFFQLTAVAILTGVLIIGLWDLGDLSTHRTRFKAGVTVLVGLTGVVLASALTRMFLYERAFGFTLLRLAVTVGLFVIAAALIGLLATIWLDGRAHVIALLCCCAVAGLLAMNLINPERFVANQNVERFEQTGKVDLDYLRLLGPDASGAIVRVLPRVPPSDAATALRDRLCYLGKPDASWRAANLGRAGAREALKGLNCGSPAPAPETPPLGG